MGDLVVAGGDGGGFVHCARCGAPAAGPCARCGAPVCGDCCVLTEGGASVWAVCTACARGGTPTLRRAWLRVVGWLLAPILVLIVLLVLVAVFLSP